MVFCLPHAGGGVHNYVAWGAAFDDVFDWVPLEYAGHFTRDDERPYESFGHAVDDLVEYIDARANGRRVGIFGHSLGGALGYEVGRRLHQNGQTAVEGIIVSSAEPPSALLTTRQTYFELDDQKFLEHLCSLGGVDVANPVVRGMLANSLPLIREDYRLHYSYRPDPDVSVEIPLHIWSGIDELIGRERRLLWRQHSSGHVGFHEFPGSHFYWNSNLDSVTNTLRNLLAPKSESVDQEGQVATCRH